MVGFASPSPPSRPPHVRGASHAISGNPSGRDINKTNPKAAWRVRAGARGAAPPAEPRPLGECGPRGAAGGGFAEPGPGRQLRPEGEGGQHRGLGGAPCLPAAAGLAWPGLAFCWREPRRIGGRERVLGRWGGGATGRGLRHAGKGVCLPGAGSRGAVPVSSGQTAEPGCRGVWLRAGGARVPLPGCGRRRPGGSEQGCEERARRRLSAAARWKGALPRVPGGGGAFLAPRSGSGRELRDSSAFTAGARQWLRQDRLPLRARGRLPYAFTCWRARSGPRLSAPSGRRCPAAGGGGAGPPCSAAGFM